MVEIIKSVTAEAAFRMIEECGNPAITGISLFDCEYDMAVMHGLRFPIGEFERRIYRIREKMHGRGVDVLMIFSAPGSMRYGQRGNVLYMSGYEPYFGDAMVILPAEKDFESVLQIDSADYFPSGCTWIDRIVEAQDPLTTLTTFLNDTDHRAMRIGLVGAPVMYPEFRGRIRKECRSSTIVEVPDIVEEERIRKSEYEIDCIKRASAIAGKGFESALEYAKPGMVEAEVVAEVERVCRLNGSEGFPHHTMVTSGNSREHLERWWYCGQRKLRKGDPWNLDFGTMFGGYCCDIARSFCLGRPSDEHISTYSRLVEAEEVARQAMMPGVLASEVNNVATRVMEKAFKDDSSGIGHGVGLEVHERPFIGYDYIKNDSVYADRMLEEGMVISVEPQVYVNDLGYLQIEDEFVVTKKGGRPLSTIRRELWC